ncbi:MAG: hypothetical protein RRZ84_06955 [Romboutsia sp.]
MSRFLAPIHTWLFNKINLAQDLEIKIVKLHGDKFKEEAINIEKEAISLYGDYIPNKPIEELIDVDNIHGWLQDKIKVVESRSSYVITKYFDLYKEGSKILTESAYINQAKECASEGENKIDSPQDVYTSLNNYILCGMPCDRVNSIINQNEEHISYKQNKNIHEANYKLGNANLEYMYQLREIWIKTFIENLNQKYKYLNVSEDETTVCKIIKN